MLYFDAYEIPWDLQQTAFHYFKAVDKLTGSSSEKDFLEAFDENGDGAGYDTVAGFKLPNVEVTSDPAKILSASFANRQETWAGA